MTNYFLTSFFIHVGLLLLLSIHVGPTSSKVEVTILEHKTQRPFLPKPDKSKTSTPGPGAGRIKEEPEIPLKDYADHLKAVVDPVFVHKLKTSNININVYLSTEVLLFPNFNGIIISVKVIKSSGNKQFDNLAIDTIKEVKQIPKPPELLIREGIVWEFSAGTRS